jgi:hypothetical protein
VTSAPVQARIEFDDPSRPAKAAVRPEPSILVPPERKLVLAPRKCAACQEKLDIIHDLQATMAWQAEQGEKLLQYIRALLKEPLSDADLDLPGNYNTASAAAANTQTLRRQHP